MYFNYKNIIEQMSQDTFKFCVSYLYGFMGYKYIPENRVRKIDLMEYMNNFDKQLSEEIKQVGGTVDLYLYILKKYLVGIINCSEQSRAEKYRTRAVSIIDSYKDVEDHSFETYDVLTIFVSLLRTGTIEKIKNVRIIDSDFDINIEDADIIKGLYRSSELIPKDLYDKRLFGKKVIYHKEILIKFFYFISILYLGMDLEKRGIFNRGN